MSVKECAKCGNSKLFMLGLCEKCFGKKYKCSVCGEPITDPMVAMDIALYESGLSRHTHGYTFMCMSCRSMGHELLQKFR